MVPGAEARGLVAPSMTEEMAMLAWCLRGEGESGAYRGQS